MRKIIYIFLIPLSLFSQTQKIEITTDVESSIIFINDNFLGNGRVETELKPGVYYLEIFESERIFNPQKITDTIIVSNGTPIILDYKFEDRITINSNPHDAFVSDDSSIIGRTPLAFIPRSKEYKIFKDGFDSKSLPVEELKPITNIDLKFTGVEPSAKFIETFWFKALFGSAVAFGASAAYFKMKADNSYDTYLETRDKRYLDDTDRYDEFSAAAFALLQINFGVLIYYFVFD